MKKNQQKEHNGDLLLVGVLAILLISVIMLAKINSCHKERKLSGEVSYVEN